MSEDKFELREDFKETKKVEEGEQEVETELNKKLRHHVVISEYASIIAAILCCITSILLAVGFESSAAVALFTDSFLDILAYVTVLILFKSNSYSKRKEQTTLLILGFLFVISSIIVEFDSITSIISQKEPVPSVAYIAVCLFQGCIFLLISVYKLVLAKKLNYNLTLLSDIFNSFISSFDSFSMAIGMIFYEFLSHSLWYFDSVCGIITGVFIFIYGGQLFYRVFTKGRN